MNVKIKYVFSLIYRIRQSIVSSKCPLSEGPEWARGPFVWGPPLPLVRHHPNNGTPRYISTLSLLRRKYCNWLYLNLVRSPGLSLLSVLINQRFIRGAFFWPFLIRVYIIWFTEPLTNFSWTKTILWNAVTRVRPELCALLNYTILFRFLDCSLLYLYLVGY